MDMPLLEVEGWCSIYTVRKGVWNAWGAAGFHCQQSLRPPSHNFLEAGPEILQDRISGTHNADHCLGDKPEYMLHPDMESVLGFMNYFWEKDLPMPAPASNSLVTLAPHLLGSNGELRPHPTVSSYAALPALHKGKSF
ncbi:hypothetical protein NDU88_001718 [Pleurodeles waltl]|uniref:Uncharacterized protein n=1 Tax=Pleurodeles waltl TaxID=8319 RepID=A0AAV7T0S9_PLEWA|nr:hypothetical protein NDU88_001718 [Pleurodeles waltl]